MSAPEPKPMDPARLARARRAVILRQDLDWRDAEMLLADRDCHAQRADAAERELVSINATGAELAQALGGDDPHHPLDVLAASVMHQLREARAEVARLRARVRVEAEDVERAMAAGLNWGKCAAWARAHGLGRLAHEGLEITAGTTNVSIRGVIATAVPHVGRSGLDILDEMAAMEVPS